MAKMILNMSMSVDGFIATESGDGEFALKTLQQDSQFDNFYQSVDILFEE